MSIVDLGKLAPGENTTKTSDPVVYKGKEKQHPRKYKSGEMGERREVWQITGCNGVQGAPTD
jgi:hypothetical protein